MLDILDELLCQRYMYHKLGYNSSECDEHGFKNVCETHVHDVIRQDIIQCHNTTLFFNFINHFPNNLPFNPFLRPMAHQFECVSTERQTLPIEVTVTKANSNVSTTHIERKIKMMRLLALLSFLCLYGRIFIIRGTEPLHSVVDKLSDVCSFSFALMLLSSSLLPLPRVKLST